MPKNPKPSSAAQSDARPPDLPSTTLEDLTGCVDYNGPRVTIEEMEDAIHQGALDSGSRRDEESSC